MFEAEGHPILTATVPFAVILTTGEIAETTEPVLKVRARATAATVIGVASPVVRFLGRSFFTSLVIMATSRSIKRYGAIANLLSNSHVE
ncbi:unnamed protein product [Cuscuta campestris]|uniref:Uncharacterized protein n=1 Tax=Cuscuta campestris TaxID=132261 RepID=A0A484L0X1_9ASTE|nr:unnamed protein product [Cuscuta campestris]